jgi:beta-N-acetylhexosaminidase
VLAAIGATGVVSTAAHDSGGSGIPSGGSGQSGSGPQSPRAGKPIPVPRSASKLLGQRIMVGFSGTSPSAALLRSVRRGDVGSVILFASNVDTRRQTVAMTGALQRAARAGGNPKLLIAVDQEGGQVKRLPGGPPTLSPPEMVHTGTVSTATNQGRATGAYLKRWGINMNLAPVSDVPTYGGAFIWRQGRAFSFNADTVSRYATAFALGVQARGVAATAKHFPGLGSAGVDTDFKRQELHPSAAQRTAALKPYESMIPRGLDAIMLTTAGLPADDPSGAIKPGDAAASYQRIVALKRKLGLA